jgi:hypothetical protein
MPARRLVFEERRERSVRARRLSLALVLGASASAGCGPGNVVAKPPSVADADEQQSTCKVAKDPLSPFIVEWPGTSKVALDAASKRGIVVVSYASCALKVLTGCSAHGGYAFTSVTPARDKIEIASEDDLYARLPLGAASLKGELSRGSTLALDYIAVGQRVAQDRPVDLSGDCEGATHFVRAITIGAYSLDASARAKAGASASIGDIGGGGERKEGDRRLHGSGDVERCATHGSASEDAALGAGCGAPLQLELSPLGGGRKTVVSLATGSDPADAKLGAIPTLSVPGSAFDRDGDGIIDSLDKCPDMPEDKDGFEDSDGCPDPDNDADGIPDVRDKCPNEPENLNGFEDDDGCPDKPPGLG